MTSSVGGVLLAAEVALGGDERLAGIVGRYRNTSSAGGSNGTSHTFASIRASAAATRCYRSVMDGTMPGKADPLAIRVQGLRVRHVAHRGKRRSARR